MSAIEQLTRRHSALLWHPESIRGVEVRVYDVVSDAGFAACEKFLHALEAVADTLKVEIAGRGYRQGFSMNYRVIFPDGRRHYRTDVLEVSMDRNSSLWVNGEKFELSHEAAVKAEQLQRALAEVGDVLDRWHAAEGDEERAMPTRSELIAVLGVLDDAWAAFEERYIGDLITIENRARQLICHAVDGELQLSALEGPEGSVTVERQARHRELQHGVVRCIAQLNAVANCRRKGRDDMTVDVLDSAQAVMDQARAQEQVRVNTVVRLLAGDVIDAFSAFRTYLRQVKSCIERVDPHLCKNKGLVACLVDWEESWEIAGRYVHNRPVLEGLCSLVDRFERVQAFIPRLATMCTDCDVELFMVLPRSVLLCYLADATGKQGPLLSLFLPHHFHSDDSRAPKPDLVLLKGHYQMATAALKRISCETGGSTRHEGFYESCMWAALIRRAVGCTDNEVFSAVGALDGPLREEAAEVLETFFRRLEGWSLELQRHCPEDWNQFSAILVQCLTGASRRKPAGKVQV